MSLSLFVALFRNAACVAKALLPASVWVMEAIPLPKAVVEFIGAYVPFITIGHDPSLIGYFISITQLYVFVVLPYFGVLKVVEALTKIQCLKSNSAKVTRVLFQKPTSEAYIITTHITATIRKVTINQLVGGVAEAVVGFSFLFLSLNSLNIQLPLHPKPVVDALIAAELGLIFFLYQMKDTLLTHRRNASNSSKLLLSLTAKFAESKKSKAGPITAATILCTAYDCGFHDNMSELVEVFGMVYSFDWVERTASSEDVDSEIQRLGKALKNISESESVPLKAGKVLGIQGPSLVVLAPVIKYQKSNADSIILDFVYLALNVIAFYAYLMGILAFYFSEGPVWLEIALLGVPHGKADFIGGLVGDIAWTVEPAIALLVAFSGWFGTASRSVVSENKKEADFPATDKKKKKKEE